MTLDKYIKTNSLTQQQFAEKIGVSKATICRYLKGQKPALAHMQKIMEVTQGAVCPNDWFPPDHNIEDEAA